MEPDSLVRAITYASTDTSRTLSALVHADGTRGLSHAPVRTAHLRSRHARVDEPSVQVEGTGDGVAELATTVGVPRPGERTG